MIRSNIDIMYKLIKLFVMTLIIIFIGLPAVDVFAVGSSLNGPNVVRAGDTITLNLRLDTSNISGMEALLEFDTSQVSLSSYTVNKNSWKIELQGNKMIVYDDTLSNPFSGSYDIVTMKFKVNSSVATSSAVNIAVKNIIVSNIDTETDLKTATYKASISAPFSSDNSLKSLSVKDNKLSPGFSSNTKNYDIEAVDFDVKALSINATANDSKAKISISGNSLIVGANEVTVTVTAENGATNSYKINVTRKQDPNYVASGNNNLKSLNSSVGILSPPFSKDITEYIIYLPFEISELEFKGVAEDSKAQNVLNSGTKELAVGESLFPVIVLAENGEQKEYKIKVVKMPEFNKETEAETTTVKETESIEERTTIDEFYESDNKDQTEKENTSKNAGSLFVVLVGIVTFLLGVVLGITTIKIYKNKK